MLSPLSVPYRGTLITLHLSLAFWSACSDHPSSHPNDKDMQANSQKAPFFFTLKDFEFCSAVDRVLFICARYAIVALVE
jgi:hypothetical protein